MEDFKSCFYEGKTQKWKENFSKGGGGGTKRYLSLSEWRVIYYYSRHIFDFLQWKFSKFKFTTRNWSSYMMVDENSCLSIYFVPHRSFIIKFFITYDRYLSLPFPSLFPPLSVCLSLSHFTILHLVFKKVHIFPDRMPKPSTQVLYSITLYFPDFNWSLHFNKLKQITLQSTMLWREFDPEVGLCERSE